VPLPFHSPIEGVGYVEIGVAGNTCNGYVLGRPGDAMIVDCGPADSAAEVVAALAANGHAPGRDVPDVPPYAALGVTVFLIHLARAGRARRNPDLTWQRLPG